MKTEIPVSIINRHREYVVYFDIPSIPDIKLIESASIVAEQNKCADLVFGPYITINNRLGPKEKEWLSKQHREQQDYNFEYRTIADATEQVKKLLSGKIPNNGLRINGAGWRQHLGLVLNIKNEVIYPRTKSRFYENKVTCTNTGNICHTPWFYCGESEEASFFIKNLTDHVLSVRAEYSPDTDDIDDSITLTDIIAGDAELIIPYKFSKFIRVAVHSQNSGISCDVWFQTRLAAPRYPEHNR